MRIQDSLSGKQGQAQKVIMLACYVPLFKNDNLYWAIMHIIYVYKFKKISFLEPYEANIGTDDTIFVI